MVNEVDAVGLCYTRRCLCESEVGEVKLKMILVAKGKKDSLSERK